MRTFWSIILLACGLMICGCGGKTATTVTPNTSTTDLWQAVLAGGRGEGSPLSFNIGYVVNPNGTLSVSEFSFLTTQGCFVSGENVSGSSSLTTNAVDVVVGSITIKVVSGDPAGNTLTLSGTENGTTITGTWTLTGGSGCTNDGGSFTMTETT